jgi:hypothetical protein
MLRAATGKAFYAADRSFKDALTKDLIARYPQLSNEEQAEMARIPLAWALLQAKWPTIPSTEQEKLRMQWRRSIEPILGRAGPASSVPNGTKQSASLDQQVNQEGQKFWVSSLRQSYMTRTTNIILSHNPF